MTTTVPVTVTPEAAARIADLGLQADVQRMIDYACHHFPELERIEVVLYDRYELGDESGLAVNAYSRRPFDPAAQADEEMVHWAVTAFPPEVLQHVILCYHSGSTYAG